MPSEPLTLRQAQQWASDKLGAIDQAASELEAALLLCHLLEKPRSHLYAWPENRLTPKQLAAYQALIARRLSGEPTAYITGRREFWSLNLKVTSDVLIPRPETELLVERSLQHLKAVNQPLIADLGTGSGAIALALASERPDAQIHASDQSTAALAVARKNARQLSLQNIQFHAGSWFQGLPQKLRYDLVVSNPPYIESSDPHLNAGDLPSEPRSALVSGRDGLDDIRLIIDQAPCRLNPGAWLLLEHGYQQADAVAKLMQSKGFVDIRCHRDLAGHDRVSEGRYHLA